MQTTSYNLRKRYVCISIQSTSQLKYWNYPNGWRILVEKLKAKGYDVYAIDKHASFGSPTRQNLIPDNAIDKTGMNIKDTMYILSGASFFIGTSSGLSWLSWAMGVPVILVSGMSLPMFEFQSNCVHVNNSEVCNGCLNDPTYEFDRGDWLYCPRHKDGAEQFICTKSITPQMVMDAVSKITG